MTWVEVIPCAAITLGLVYGTVQCVIWSKRSQYRGMFDRRVSVLLIVEYFTAVTDALDAYNLMSVYWNKNSLQGGIALFHYCVPYWLLAI